MKKLFATLSAFLCVLFLGVSCEQKPEPVPDPVIRPDSAGHQVVPEAGSAHLEYTIENPIEGAVLSVKSDHGWLSVGEVTENVVTFNFEANPSESERRGILVLTYPNAREFRYPVDQEGKKAPDPIASKINVISTIEYVPSQGWESFFNYSIENPVDGAKLVAKNSSDDSWIKVTSINETSVIYTASENTGASRTTGVTLSYEGAEDVVVTFVQEAAPVFTFTIETQEFNLSQRSEFVKIPYTCSGADSFEISIDCEASWLRNSKVYYDDSYIQFWAAPNETGAERSTDYKVTCTTSGGKSETITVKVTQSTRDYVITLSPSSLTVSNEEQTISFSISVENPTSVNSIYVLCSDTWISKSGLSSDNVASFTVSKNTGGSRRTTTIKVTFYNHADATFTLTQLGVDLPSNVVDLGLPSGKFWANANMGATSSSPIGTYFAWGEVSGKSSFSWSNYKWGTENNISKYNASDSKTRLSSDDDVARSTLGSGWSLPSQYDVLELVENCKKSVYVLNGVDCVKFTSKINGAYIIIPNSGYMDGSSKTGSGTNIYLWCSDKPEGAGGNVNNGWSFNGTYAAAMSRYIGMNVRAVYSL